MRQNAYDSAEETTATPPAAAMAMISMVVKVSEKPNQISATNPPQSTTKTPITPISPSRAAVTFSFRAWNRTK